MPRGLSATLMAALAARTCRPRDFVWFTVKDRDTGEPYSEGFWSGSTPVSAQVVDGITGSTVERVFTEAGGLVSGPEIPFVRNLTVQRVELLMSNLSERIKELIRGYEPRQGRIQIYRGMLSVTGNTLIEPATPRFVGYIDQVEIMDAAAGEYGSVKITCTSSTREFSRSNFSTRTNEDQRRTRSDTDAFFRDVATIGEREIFWGTENARD